MAPLETPLKEVLLDLQRGRCTEDHFRLLFQRYYRPVLGFFRRKQVPDEDARELAQEVFVAVYKGVGKLQDLDRFEGWLFTLARNVFCNYLERTHAQKRAARTKAPRRTEDDAQVQDPVDLVRDPGKDPLTGLIDREKVDLLRGEMMKLPQQMRACVVMQVVEEASIEEIARRQSVSVNTVKSHLKRARQLLRDRLEPVFGLLDFGEAGSHEKR